MATNYNAPGPWNNFNPIPVLGAPSPHAGERKIGNYSTGTYTPTAAQISNLANTNKYPLNDYSADDRFRTAGGMQPNRGLAPQSQPTNTGKLSFTFGGGGGGGGGASVPSNVLTPRQFSPYESTYVPPTPATPDPYNWATRDPYTYGEGLSNAGAAYDIWGSAPGTNPYLMTVPSDYTPGLLGLQPVQLPDNVPSTNVGANINNPGSPPTTKPVKMNPIAGVPQAVYEKAMADTYRKVKTGEGQFGEGSYGYTGQDERATGGVNMSRAGIMAGTTPMKVTGPNYAPVTSFETKKQGARVSIQQAAVKRYGKKPGGTTKNYGVTGKRIVGGR